LIHLAPNPPKRAKKLRLARSTNDCMLPPQKVQRFTPIVVEAVIAVATIGATSSLKMVSLRLREDAAVVTKNKTKDPKVTIQDRRPRAREGVVSEAKDLQKSPELKATTPDPNPREVVATTEAVVHQKILKVLTKATNAKVKRKNTSRNARISNRSKTAKPMNTCKKKKSGTISI